MKPSDNSQDSSNKGQVVIVGGAGGLSERYREIVEGHGLELRHYEKRVPSSTKRIAGKVAAVIVIAGMVSHALRDQAKSLVDGDAPIVYLRTASVSAVRDAVAGLDKPAKTDAVEARRASRRG